LYDPFYELSDKLTEIKLMGGQKGMHIHDEAKEGEVQSALKKYVDWVYKEYNTYCLSGLA
jgi:hypothetical protein